MVDSESDQDIDDIVASLSEETLRRIDEAFDRAISESLPPEDKRPRKRRRITEEEKVEPELAGGFLLDDDDGDETQGGFVAGDSAAGGFLVEDSEEDDERDDNTIPISSQPTHISLSLIPSALQLLDLDPSDPQVLSVFENAASSWDPGSGRRRRQSSSRSESNLSGDEERDEAPEQLVSRRDWRAVCAALMPSSSRVNTNGSLSPLSSVGEPDNDAGSVLELEEEADSGSSAILSAELEENESSSGEYVPQTKGKGKRKSKGKGKGKAQGRSRRQGDKASSSDVQSQSKRSLKGKGKVKASSPKAVGIVPLTARQEQDTLAAFSLFFPTPSKSSKAGTRSSLTDEELSKKKLTIKDIANAAASIKEKITAEEIIEMLTFFSSSPGQKIGNSNPSMSFLEFQQMMIVAKLA